MRKKFRICCLLLCIVFVLSGCGSTIELTDEENRLIAEYAAEMLLKYDANYDDKYYYDEAIDVNTTEIQNTTETTTETSTEDTSATTEEPTTTESTTEDSNDTTEDNQGQSDPPVSVGSETDIAKIVGVDSVSVKYNKYLLVDRYPALDQEGAFIYLEAPEGKKLMVVKFDVTNITGESVDFDLFDYDVGYKIVVNDKKTAKPLLTILMDDLSTFDATLLPNSTQNAVLVFQISDNMVSQIETVKLRVNYNNEENVIDIQ